LEGALVGDPRKKDGPRSEAGKIAFKEKEG